MGVALLTAGALAAVPGCSDRGPDLETVLVPGVSRELARERAERIDQLSYHLRFDVRPDEVVGRARVAFQLRSARRPLVLDFQAPEGALRSVRANDREVEAELRNGHLVIPRSRLRRGPNRLDLEFVAGERALNRSDDYLYTLFVPDRAHRAFPSFDQPDLKARFQLELEVPEEWMAVSNTAVSDPPERVPSAGPPARTVYRFAPTEPLPTYLFAFAAGRFRVEEAERNGRRFRLFHRETDSLRVARNRDAIFDLHARALAWMEDYTGIAYPFGKFDFVAVPGFQYNGMEHPGAVFYRAENLFLDASATRTEELARASVIAHETSHMWFGDLVTMPWFDDVWMKEVFANFMAAKIVHPAFPEIDHELRFLLAHHPAAYSVDRTAGANPIRQELENLSEAGSLYGHIIYRKAPVVMRQLELLVGERTLRSALREYLSRHAFGNASWSDLIGMLDRRTELDLIAWSRVWVEEAGRPWVGLELDEAGGTIRSLRVVQHDPEGRGRVWPQRVGVHLAWPDSTATLSVVLEGASVRVPEARGLSMPTYALADATGVGYGHFLLEPRTHEWLPEGLPSLRPPVARAVAWLSLWDELLEGRVPSGRAFETALSLTRPGEDELLVERVLEDLVVIYWRFLPPAERERVASRLEEALWSRMHAPGTSSLKAAYLEALRATATSRTGWRRLEGLWRGDRRVPGLDLSERDRTGLALDLALREVPGWETILEAQLERIRNPDRRERFAFLRPAVDADPEVRDAFFASLADPRNRRREPWVVNALAYLHHPMRAETSLRYVRPALEMLEDVRRTGDIFFPTRWLEATLSGYRSREAALAVRDFLEERPELPRRSREKVLQAADLLFRTSGVVPPSVRLESVAGESRPAGATEPPVGTAEPQTDGVEPPGARGVKGSF